MTLRTEPRRPAASRAVLLGMALAATTLAALVPRAGAQESTTTTGGTAVMRPVEASATTATTAPPAETSDTTGPPTTTTTTGEPPGDATTTTEAPADEPTTTTTAGDEDEAAVAGEAATATTTTTQRRVPARVTAEAGLSISVPSGTVNAGTVAAGATSVTRQLGAVTVNDDRPGLLTGLASSWTATVSASDFVTGGGTAAERVPRSAVTYSSGPNTAGVGVTLFVPSGAVTLDQSRRAANATGLLLLLVGSSATWNPTLTISLGSGRVAGTYTGTITHSVA